MASIQIKDVSPTFYRTLKSEAAQQGKSVKDYVLGVLARELKAQHAIDSKVRVIEDKNNGH